MTRLFLATCLAAALLISDAWAGTLDTIKQTGAFKIGYREDAPPFSYKSPIGEPAGYSVDLCRVMATGVKELLGMTDLKVTYVPVTTEDRFKAVQDGRIDILCGATTATLARRKIVDFSLPIFITGASVLLRADGPPEFKSLAGKKVGVRASTTTEKDLVNTLKAAKIDANVVKVKSHDEGIEMLADGKLSAYFGDRAILVFLASANKKAESLRIAKQLYSYEPYALAIKRGDSDFRLVIDRVISRIYRTAAIDAIYRATFGESKPGDLMTALFLINTLPE